MPERAPRRTWGCARVRSGLTSAARVSAGPPALLPRVASLSPARTTAARCGRQRATSGSPSAGSSRPGRAERDRRVLGLLERETPGLRSPSAERNEAASHGARLAPARRPPPGLGLRRERAEKKLCGSRTRRQPPPLPPSGTLSPPAPPPALIASVCLQAKKRPAEFMELGVLLLFGLTVASSTGFSLPDSRSLLPLGGGGSSGGSSNGLRFLGLRQRDGQGNEVLAEGQLSANRTSVEKVAGPGEAHHRAKRCTCYTYKDKECVYYCHLDIIWINTPERTVPYGLSNYRGRFRGKRSTEHHRKSLHSTKWPPVRCSCADRCDKQCMHFCTRTYTGQCNKEQVIRTAETEPHQNKEYIFAQ